MVIAEVVRLTVAIRAIQHANQYGFALAIGGRPTRIARPLALDTADAVLLIARGEFVAKHRMGMQQLVLGHEAVRVHFIGSLTVKVEGKRQRRGVRASSPS